MDQQSQWSVSLGRTRQSLRQKDITPTEDRLQQVKEAINYFKTRLRAAVNAKNIDLAEKYLNNLIQQRAIQTALLVEATRNAKGKIDEVKAQDEIKDYYLDCTYLRQAVYKEIK